MAISWTPYSDPLTEFVRRHPSWGGDEVPDGGAAAKGEWADAGDGDDPPVYDGPLAATALGLMGLNKEKLAFCTYSLWVARTDFDVTRWHVMRLARLPGVEVLKPLTRYAFVLGVGPQFDAELVKGAVRRLLDPAPFDRVAHLSAYAAAAGLPAWAVVRGPDGELDLLAADDPAAVDREAAALGDLWEVTARG